MSSSFQAHDFFIISTGTFLAELSIKLIPDILLTKKLSEIGYLFLL